ncbi:cell cycle checkpoint control protein RAD9A [Prorops nasuta]|uniref:cell cycle checkpoint control protein RAD9A n=1 Tax=Prorops nasuta TaxID=863751 RepID=UPI0034CFF18C
MKCIVPGANVKILAKAIHALAKIGDEMYVQPQESSLSFRTVNIANSAYADFSFTQDYFAYYSYGDFDEEDSFKSKISMRSVMTVFKSPNSIDKQVETCHIKLESNASTLLLVLKYKNGITKTYLLPIIDCENLQATYEKEQNCNSLMSQPRVLVDAVQNFQNNVIEITLEVTPQKILLRNYIDNESAVSCTTRTQLALAIAEFDRYSVNNETNITFCMKELRAILQFSEAVGLPVYLQFEAAGRPVVFILKNSTFEANLVLSTLNPHVEKSDNTLLTNQEASVDNRTSGKRASKNSSKSSTGTKKMRKSSKVLGHDSIDSSHSTNIDNCRNNDHDLIESNIQLENNPSNVCNNNRVYSGGNKMTDEALLPETPSTNNRNTNRESLKTSINKTNQSDLSDRSIGCSPPQKKSRLIFRKCFESTFHPAMLAGHDIILAEDSDDGD